MQVELTELITMESATMIAGLFSSTQSQQETFSMYCRTNYFTQDLEIWKRMR